MAVCFLSFALQLGNADAPAGRGVAISFLTVPSAHTLVTDLEEVGVRALALVKAVLLSYCTALGGYVIEASEGLCLAAFHDPTAAVVWALDSVEALKYQVGTLYMYQSMTKAVAFYLVYLKAGVGATVKSSYGASASPTHVDARFGKQRLAQLGTCRLLAESCTPRCVIMPKPDRCCPKYT